MASVRGRGGQHSPCPLSRWGAGAAAPPCPRPRSGTEPGSHRRPSEELLAGPGQWDRSRGRAGAVTAGLLVGRVGCSRPPHHPWDGHADHPGAGPAARGSQGPSQRGSAEGSFPSIPSAKIPIKELIFKKRSGLCVSAARRICCAIMVIVSSGGFSKEEGKENAFLYIHFKCKLQLQTCTLGSPLLKRLHKKPSNTRPSPKMHSLRRAPHLSTSWRPNSCVEIN